MKVLVFRLYSYLFLQWYWRLFVRLLGERGTNRAKEGKGETYCGPIGELPMQMTCEREWLVGQKCNIYESPFWGESGSRRERGRNNTSIRTFDTISIFWLLPDSLSLYVLISKRKLILLYLPIFRSTYWSLCLYIFLRRSCFSLLQKQLCTSLHQLLYGLWFWLDVQRPYIWTLTRSLQPVHRTTNFRGLVVFLLPGCVD